jgi:NADPH:quinone reductase-like Zn-dependent oxidoreductase
MTTMKAVRLHKFGGPDVLIYEDAPKPEVGEGEILLQVKAAGVNPVDWKTREGYLEQMMPHTLPLILGLDAAGIVEAVGPGVTQCVPGDKVVAHLTMDRDGAYAEYVIAKAEFTAPKPPFVDFVTMASLPVAAVTAWKSLFTTGGLEAGQTVLIHAASGGVGTMAVQLAKWKGARVIGTASAKNHDFVLSLGADEVIDYNAVKFEDVVKSVDVVFDTIGGDTQERSFGVLKPNGILVSIVSTPSEETAKAHGVRASHVWGLPDGPILHELVRLVASGDLKPVIATTMPLAEARRAQELGETNHTRGKIVLTV